MITAETIGLGASSQKLEGHAIVIRDRYGNPIALAVEVAPSVTRLFTIEDKVEFRNALEQYGVNIKLDVSVMKV